MFFFLSYTDLFLCPSILPPMVPKFKPEACGYLYPLQRITIWWEVAQCGPIGAINGVSAVFSGKTHSLTATSSSCRTDAQETLCSCQRSPQRCWRGPQLHHFLPCPPWLALPREDLLSGYVAESTNGLRRFHFYSPLSGFTVAAKLPKTRDCWALWKNIPPPPPPPHIHTHTHLPNNSLRGPCQCWALGKHPNFPHPLRYEKKVEPRTDSLK